MKRKTFCSVQGCKNQSRSVGLCAKHYHKFQRYGDPIFVSERTKRIGQKCKVEGCGQKATAQLLCPKHYTRFKKYGSVNGMAPNFIGARKNFPLEYSSYNSMKQRCLNKNSKCYESYGGRGIGICDRWLGKTGFRNFVDDMGKRAEGTTLDRIDVNGNYCPENCRWANRNVQNSNKRKHRERCGVYRSYNRWTARIIKDGIRYEKSFLTREEAISQREEWEEKLL